jgi:type VI secretion system ImpC/EvpB family protein
MENLLEQLEAKAAGCRPSLPLKLLVVSDCTGRDAEQPPVKITNEGVSGLLESLHPKISLTVDNQLQKGGQKIPVELEVRRIEDFRPESLISQIEILSSAASDGNPMLGDQMDAILHHPEFQRMEASWLGLERLCGIAAGKDGVHLEVLPARRKTLKEIFHQKIFEPEYQGAVDLPLSAVYLDYRFSHEPADLPMLETLADDCAALQVPLIAAVSPAFFQLKNIAHLPNLPDIAAKLQQPAYANWRRFQTNPVSRWVCLTANRYLAREPYALKTESGAPVDYQEKAEASHPEWYGWADAGWLMLCNMVRSFAKYRHCVVIDGMSPDSAHFNLPTRPFPKKANVTVPSPTEILIDDAKAWEIVRGGITMLVGISDGAIATFPLLANIYRLKPGVLTTESALSYQLIAGHLSHYLLGIYNQIPVEGGSDAISAFFQEKLIEFLVPFIGEKPEENVQTEIVEGEGESARRTLKLTVRPLLKLQGKDVDFTFELGL